jgi:hypothetical protein
VVQAVPYDQEKYQQTSQVYPERKYSSNYKKTGKKYSCIIILDGNGIKVMI